VLAALRGVAGIIEGPRLYPYLSDRANLEMLADFDRGGEGRGTIDEVLDTVELRERAEDRVSEYSQGMRQRLGIGACLVRRPRLMLLDEPANGVDPAGRALLSLTRALSEAEITIRALVPEQLTLERVFFELTEPVAEPQRTAA
jgi:ABC-2 type transport system ATP-binding protein